MERFDKLKAPMKAKRVPSQIALFTFISTLLVLVATSFAMSHRVGVGNTHGTVASALAVALPGDTVVIASGIYRESGLLLDKRLSLIGDTGTVLDANHGGTILEISADSVFVTGITFRNVGVNHLREHGAIWVSSARAVRIVRNRFQKTFFGVYGLKAKGTLIEGNSFEGLNGNEFSNGNGIHFWKSDSARIVNNTIQQHRDGIYLEFTGNSEVIRNTCEGNVRYGLHFMYANGNLYYGNTFRNNGAGVAVMFSRNVDMRENVFEKNWGASSYGLLLKSIKESRIEKNHFVQNTVAIMQEASSRIHIEDNSFVSNGWAFRIFADCDANIFSRNRFERNTFDLGYNVTPGNTNIFHRNIWDRYSGYDLDRDGIGDIPHRPVELFSAIVQNHPQAMALLRGHFPGLLNILERLFPTLTPASLQDTEPLMPNNKVERKAA
jgi:nitrous oxidase accessory protein